MREGERERGRGTYGEIKDNAKLLDTSHEKDGTSAYGMGKNEAGVSFDRTSKIML